jgi:hypothetical protein
MMIAWGRYCGMGYEPDPRAILLGKIATILFLCGTLHDDNHRLTSPASTRRNRP